MTQNVEAFGKRTQAYRPEFWLQIRGAYDVWRAMHGLFKELERLSSTITGRPGGPEGTHWSASPRDV